MVSERQIERREPGCRKTENGRTKQLFGRLRILVLCKKEESSANRKL